MWNPCQVATENVNSERSRHEDRADPEAPVTMHALPVRTWIRLSAVATMSFKVMLVSCHLFSYTARHLLRRASFLFPVIATCTMVDE